MSLSKALEQETYNTNHGKRSGHIFNYMDSQIDAERMRATLENLNFEVNVYEQFTTARTEDKLRELSLMDYTNVDCLMIVVIAHGGSTGFKTKDEDFDPNSLWSYFTTDDCRSLAGKPKIFMFDACRGKNTDKGNEVQFDGNINNCNVFKIPKMADILVIYSTQEGHYGFAEANDSWFITEFCTELQRSHETTDLLKMLTRVNRKVAMCYEAKTKDTNLNGSQQAPTFTSSLTRLLYLR